MTHVDGPLLAFTVAVPAVAKWLTVRHSFASPSKLPIYHAVRSITLQLSSVITPLTSYQPAFDLDIFS